MPTASIRDVELVSTGEWSASTGTTRITLADLEAMLAAAQDPEVDAAPIKLGHVDPRFDGEPAAGWVVPTRIEARGQRHTLIGDLVGMPTRLAEVAPTAYRRRSVELLWRVRTPAGRAYAAVLTGVALLGVAAPAVKGLADVMTLFKGQHPVAGDPAVVLFTGGIDDEPQMVPFADTANVPQANVEAPNDEPRTQPEPGGQMLTEARVRELLNLEGDADVEAALRQLAAQTETEVAPGQQPPAPLEPGQDMPLVEAEPNPTTTPAEQPAAAPADDEGAVQAGRAPELVQLSAANLAQLQADAAAGRAAAEQLAAQRREETVTRAMREGRIAPSERATWLSALEENEQSTVTLLSGLAQRFSTAEAGFDAAPEAGPQDDEAWGSFSTSLYPTRAS